jgi:TonB-dependent receptor
MSTFSSSPFKAGLLATAAAFTMCGAANAQTAEQGPAPAAAPASEQIIVTAPIRDSQEAAINAKRDADNVVDIISSDTIGRFPDQNLADSLGRLPGLAIERDQGQARYINFRGSPFRYTAISFDGIQVPGAENGRVPRFDSIPSVVTRAVEANKAVTPAMTGEAVAGLINIRTFDPFERSGLSASLEAGYGEQQLGGGPVNKYNGRISYSNDTFGIVAYGSNNRRVQNTDNRELGFDAAGQIATLDFRSYFVEREDNAWGGRAEFRPASGPLTRVFASTLFSEFIDNEERNQFVFGLNGAGPTGYDASVSVARMLEAGEYENSTFTNIIGADFDVGGWEIETRAALTETENSTFLPIPRSERGSAAADYDITNVESPVLTLYSAGTRNPLSLANVVYPLNLGVIVASNLDFEATTFKVDATRDTELLGDTTLAFGAQYDIREGSGIAIAQAGGLFPSSVNINSFRTNVRWYSDMNNSIGATYYDNEGLRAAWERAIGGFNVAAPADQVIQIEENILSAYGMATTRFDWGNIVYGVRVEGTDYTTDGPSVEAPYSDDYLNVLPSIHVNFDLTDDLKLRVSGTTGLSRPTYNEMRASASINRTSTPVSVTGGNPTLEPEKTWGADASLEWYFAPASLISAGAFYRNIENVIYADGSTIDGGVYDPSAAGETWDYTGFVNGQNGRLSGIELNLMANAADLLPEPFDGLGVTANVTLLDSEFETNNGTKFSLPGTSETIYNASIYYEKYGASVRLNYQFRDDWLSTTENDSFGEYWAAQQRVDISLRYALPFDVAGVSATLFANGNNLTDETDVRYVGTAATPNQVEGYGRYWLAGLRLDY